MSPEELRRLLGEGAFGPIHAVTVVDDGHERAVTVCHFKGRAAQKPSIFLVVETLPQLTEPLRPFVYELARCGLEELTAVTVENDRLVISAIIWQARELRGQTLSIEACSLSSDDSFTVLRHTKTT